ncbi:MAG TPA: histidine phosphatase family protein [Dehalococcoidia bacterium]|nr:histidine phosphatase family protein [Dehalococcoidia bacterium]
MSTRPMADPDRDPRTRPAPIDPMAYYFEDVLLLNKRDAVRLYLIRHGQSASNEARLEGKPGEHDPPLTKVGEEQARRLGERMAAYGVDAVYASPLQRAYNTGDAIAQRLGLKVQVIDDLQEINEPMRGTVGPDPRVLPDGLTHEDIKRRFEELPSWDNLPGSERSADFRARIVRAMDQIIADNPGKKVAVACHGGVIQSYVAHILGIRSDFPFYAFNASITSVRAWRDRRALWRLNDLAHLEGMRMT